jgi:hypothetical protein
MIKRIVHFFSTPPVKAAQMELAVAERRLLEAEASKEHAQSVIDLNLVRIQRLRAFIAGPASVPKAAPAKLRRAA